MLRKSATFEITRLDEFKARIRQWLRKFSYFSYLDSNEYKDDNYSKYEALIGAGKISSIHSNYEQAFRICRQYQEYTGDWIFGYFGYDLKNDVEKLNSANPDGLFFPDMYFFQPQTVLEVFKDQVVVHSTTEPDQIFREITATGLPVEPSVQAPALAIGERMNAESYLQNVEMIRQQIEEGDVYELNLCREFYCENAEIDPWVVFGKLNKLAGAPFSAFLKIEDHYILSASPERFLKKEGEKLISQPVKGTVKRGTSPFEDRKLQEKLFKDKKERAENVMIVDLVRNDLAKSAKTGSVKVPELFGIYKFNSVHQMISSVTADLKENACPFEAIRAAFPMGSMTGAPKVMAMDLIENYENRKRGVFSGAIGYFNPQLDFDFNVVIRSILYNQSLQYLSFQTGGAITYDSVARQEYEETLLKAESILSILENG